jgi:hypothetical protein
MRAELRLTPVEGNAIPVLLLRASAELRIQSADQVVLNRAVVWPVAGHSQCAQVRHRPLQ